MIAPDCTSRALTAATGTLMLSRPEPVGSTATALPATSAVVPPGVVIEPAFVTTGPASTTVPPDGVTMVPSLTTGPEASLPPERRSLPAMNWSGSTARLVASRLPTLICAPGAK